MKSFLKNIFLFFLLCFLFSSTLQAKKIENKKGKQLARKVFNRDNGSNSIAKVSMVLEDKNAKKKNRSFFTFVKQPKPGYTSTLIRFLTPADIKGTGLLTIEEPKKDTDQWIFLPELGRSRRIASSRKGGKFVHSDYTYEDLRNREVHLDHHLHIGTEKINGINFEILESVPVKASNSIYSKRKVWIHPQTLIIFKAQLFKKNKLIKELQVHNIEKIQNYWTAMSSTITDLKSKHKTHIKIEKIIYNSKLSKQLWKKKSLENPASEQKYYNF